MPALRRLGTRRPAKQAQQHFALMVLYAAENREDAEPGRPPGRPGANGLITHIQRAIMRCCTLAWAAMR